MGDRDFKRRKRGSTAATPSRTAPSPPARGRKPAAKKPIAQAQSVATSALEPKQSAAKRATSEPAKQVAAHASGRAAREQERASHQPSTLPREVRPSDIAAGFAIVGIGASAGGLEALELFFQHVPEQSGAAYVVIQHLDPTQKGMLVELLQRSCRLPVAQAQDDAAIEVDHCYVIPPNKDLSVLNGRLQLLPMSSPRGHNLPIDFFFRSLAADQQERSIGVILSGMGSDGTLGMRAIKERAGAAFVQALSSAKFDGMPRSIIDAGLADVVAPVEQLPGRIFAYRTHAPFLGRGGSYAVLEELAPSTLDGVFELLRAHTGNDFSLYKRSTIARRIERRLSLHQIDGIAHYVRYLRDNPKEIQLLFQELLIGVTNFFRDPAAWEFLRSQVMPSLLAGRSAAGVLRAWVPGCSTGEEAYSLAMVFQEAIEPFKAIKNIALQIFATDLDHDAIETARLGLFPDNIAADVSPERLRRFFVRDERGYRVSQQIRETVVFAPQNLIMDPPFTKLDILTCRNLLIYLSPELQKKLIPLFHYTLNPDGILFLGSAEAIGSFNHLFAPLDGKTRLFRRIEPSVGTAPLEFPPRFLSSPQATEHERAQTALQKSPAPHIERLTDRVLAARFAPLGVLCSEKGDVLYMSGRAGKYFEPAVGKANLSIFAMAREGLRYELSSAFATMFREHRAVTTSHITVGTNGGTQLVDLSVQQLDEPKELRGTVLVVIADVADGGAVKPPQRSRRVSESRRIGELERSLQRARDEVQTTHEEMQTSQEELKSTNEELQSANEELQSTNEELTTSKEEMQSLNEELQTVNYELQSKVDELSRANSDMKNLLNSTEIATLFLDGELRVRRFTTPTAKIIKLIASDVGREITDIASDLDYAALVDDAREVLRTLVFKEQAAAARDGRWFNVRILPYRTLENVIDGVVITFTDVSAARALELGLREQASQLLQMTESLPTLVWGCRPDGSCNYVSHRWVEYTGVPEVEQLGFGWLEHLHPDDRDRVRDRWRAAIKAGANFDIELRLRSLRGDYRWFQMRAVAIRDAQGTILKWYGINTDIDELKREPASP